MSARSVVMTGFSCSVGIFLTTPLGGLCDCGCRSNLPGAGLRRGTYQRRVRRAIGFKLGETVAGVSGILHELKPDLMGACRERHASRVDAGRRLCPLVNFQLPINIERRPVIYSGDEAAWDRRKIERPLPCGTESTNRFQDVAKDNLTIALARNLCI